MKTSYEKVRNEFKEIEEIAKEKIMSGPDITVKDLEEAIIIYKLFDLLKAVDEFSLACIDAMENQNKKLDEILKKLKD